MFDGYLSHSAAFRQFVPLDRVALLAVQGRQRPQFKAAEKQMPMLG